MSTSNELQAVDMIELGCDLITEEPASTARGDSPSLYVLRITPNQVTEGTLMRNLLSAGDNTDLVNGTDLRAEATMNAKDLAIDNCSQD